MRQDHNFDIKIKFRPNPHLMHAYHHIAQGILHNESHF